MLLVLEETASCTSLDISIILLSTIQLYSWQTEFLFFSVDLWNELPSYIHIRTVTACSVARTRKYAHVTFTFSHLTFLDQELIPYRYSFCCYCWGDALQKSLSSFVSNGIGLKYGKIFLQVNVPRTDRRSLIFDLTPHFIFLYFIL